jgi:hypothetical protein
VSTALAHFFAKTVKHDETILRVTTGSNLNNLLIYMYKETNKYNKEKVLVVVVVLAVPQGEVSTVVVIFVDSRRDESPVESFRDLLPQSHPGRDTIDQSHHGQPVGKASLASKLRRSGSPDKLNGVGFFLPENHPFAAFSALFSRLARAQDRHDHHQQNHYFDTSHFESGQSEKRRSND